jgi:Putative zinc-finger
MGCEACEALCLDAVDGTLTAAEQAMFDRHVAGCVECAEQFSEAKRGAAWMEMLKEHRPEPSPGLMQRILAQTSEAEISKVFPRFGVVPTPRFAVVEQRGFREKLWDSIEAAFTFDTSQSHFQPRMAMTTAMAFFSIALTLNLSGVRLADLRPGTIQRTVAEARASAARQFQSIKVVYQVESRVNELRDDNRDPGGPFGSSGAAPKQQAPAAAPATQDQKPQPKAPNGSSELMVPGAPRLQRAASDEKRSNEEETAADADALRMQKGA